MFPTTISFQERQDNKVKCFEGNKFIFDFFFHQTKMERTLSVLRNKTILGPQIFMTKYEPHSCSKIVWAVRTISLAFMLSNLGCWDGLWGKELVAAKPFESIKACFLGGFFFKGMSRMWTISWVFKAEKRIRMINKDGKEGKKNTELNDITEKCTACTQTGRRGRENICSYVREVGLIWED